MKTYATCNDCEREMIPQRLWNAADKGDRNQWRREGKTPMSGVEICTACYARNRRAKESPTLEVSPIAPNTCTTCATKMIRSAAYLAATGEQRAEWLADGLPKSAGSTCHPCYMAEYRAMRARLNYDPRPIEHEESPIALQDGRWVLDPLRRVQVWQAA